MLRKMFNDLLKGGKADFTDNHHDRYRGHCSGILHSGSEIEHNSKYSRQAGIYSQGPGWGAWDGKLLRGNVRANGVK